MFKKNFWLIAVISFTVGLFLSHNFLNPKNETIAFISPFLYFFLSLSFLLLTVKTRKKIPLILFFCFLAIWRYQLIFPQSSIGRIENHLDQDFSIIGRIIDEPEIKSNKQRMKVKIISAQDDKGNDFKVLGKILVSTSAYPIYNYNDIVKIDGKYVAPGIIGDFDYGLYLKRFRITTVSYYPRIKKIELTEFSNNRKAIIKIKIYNFKNKIKQQFNSSLSSTSSVILTAMLMGDKSGLDQDLRNSFSQSGLSHIIAISGMHISLLSALFLNFLLAINISRKKSFYLSIFFLLFYLTLIGAPASACRASLMGFLSFLAVYMGRPGNLVNALYFSAILLLLVNPLLIFGDIGFQLSFMAVLGIIYLHPKVKEFLQRKVFYKKFFRQNKSFEAVIDILSITISVQLIAGPVLVSSFKQFSLIAPISNLMVVWLLPLIISISIIAIIIYSIIPFLGQLVYLIIDLLLSYIVFIGGLSNKIPASFVNIDNWSVHLTLIYYLLLFYVFRDKKKRLTKTELK